MIITRLQGGLGNQMFQYAIAKKLALLYNTKVVLDTTYLDTTYYDGNTIRKYSLGIFEFNSTRVSNNELYLFGIENDTFRPSLYYRFLKKNINPVIVKEKQLNYDAEVFTKANKYTYLDGYWQTEKYFSDIRDQLMLDFTVKKILEGDNLKFSKHIQAVNSVSIHIRRGDYLTSPIAYNTHGVCDIDYYNKAVDSIIEKIRNPILFVFSDEIAWAKENLKTPIDTFYVEHNNSEKAHEDLRLMSLCKHNIIANSSFSWWGAWLNANKSKIVITPNKWFKTNKFNLVDIIPEKWIKL